MHGTPILHYLIDATKITANPLVDSQEIIDIDSVIMGPILDREIDNAIKKEVEKIEQQVKKWEQKIDGDFLAHILVLCQDGFYRSGVISQAIVDKLEAKEKYKILLGHTTVELVTDIKKEVFDLVCNHRVFDHQSIKGVIVSSLGENLVDPTGQNSKPSEMRGVDIINITIDAQEMLYESAQKYPQKPGTDPEVMQLYRDELEVQNWIIKQKDILREKIDNYRFSKDQIVLHICFSCWDGFRRSPYAAKVIGEWIQKEFKLPVQVVHFTLEAALAAKRFLGITD